jgi:hypothetical protein
VPLGATPVRAYVTETSAVRRYGRGLVASPRVLEVETMLSVGVATLALIGQFDAASRLQPGRPTSYTTRALASTK